MNKRELLKTLGYDIILEMLPYSDVELLFRDLEDIKDTAEELWTELDELVESGWYSDKEIV